MYGAPYGYGYGYGPSGAPHPYEYVHPHQQHHQYAGAQGQQQQQHGGMAGGWWGTHQAAPGAQAGALRPLQHPGAPAVQAPGRPGGASSGVHSCFRDLGCWAHAQG